MANPQLSVEITAKIDGLRDAFNKAIRETNNLDAKTKQSLGKIDKNFEQLANDIDKSMGRAVASVSSASNSVSKSLANAAVAGSKSKNTYMELGRVLQDLPFGFTGIQNNLTQLIPAAGALGLGFSALISALTFLQVGTGAWTRGLDGNKKAIDAINKSGQDYLDTLSQVNQARIGGEQSTAKEITELKVLYSAYQNANLPLSARKEAYKELQDQYPAYFGSLKFEQTASDKTRTAYDSLTQSILATGRARAAVELIAKNESRKLENEQKIVDLEKEAIKLREITAKQAAKALEEIKTNSTREAAGLSAAFKASNLQDKVNENLEQRRNIVTDINKLDANNLQLLKSVNVELANGAKILGNVGALDKVKEVAKPKNTNILGGLTTANTGALGSLTDQLVGISGLEIKPPKGLDEYVKLMQAGYEASVRFDESLKNLATTAIGSGLADAFSQIGVALASGTNAIEAFGTALLAAFSDFLGQLGQMFIKEGIAQIGYGIAKNLILPGSGAGNIAGGTGMIAAGAGLSVLGGALSGAGKGGKKQNSKNTAIPAFASGVTNFRGGMALVGERGAELVRLPTGSNVIPHNRSMSMIGANKGQSINLTGGIGISGRDLVLFIDNARASMNRNR